jgi:hypothetical protein
MRNRPHSHGDGGGPERKPHDRFLELCALSTSGELSEHEKRELDAHMADCSECRKALQEFEALATIGVPLLHSALSSIDSPGSESLPLEREKSMPNTIAEDRRDARAEQVFCSKNAGPPEPPASGRRLRQLNWNYLWMPFAAAVVLTVALGVYSYQVGKRKGQEAERARSTAADTHVDALEQQMSDLGHERETMRAELAEQDREIAELHRQLTVESEALNEAKNVQAELELNMEKTLESQSDERQKLAVQQSELSQQLAAAQSSLAKSQTELTDLKRQRAEHQSRSESLEAQIQDLHGQLRDREQSLNKEEELLAHDRDIRELMGARELYIAEVYDVGKDGQTKKPYGRVFYTRGKSLVFYAYDLDQQAGGRKASTFQAWGSHGADRQQATSLGVFYEDNAAKKRWVLKSNDPKKLEQIDAVFVTVEPNGGSRKPSGKPLLFAYLKVEPNHP